MRRQLLHAGGSVAFVRLAGVVAGFALTVVLARTLGAEGLGLYGFVVLIVMLAGVPVSYGWATLMLRSVSGAMATRDWSEARGIQRLGAAVAVIVAVIALTAGLGWATLRPEGWVTPAIVLILVAILLCDQFSALRLAALRGLGHPVYGQLPETLLRPGLVLVVFLLAAWVVGAADVKLAFIALLVASLVSVAVGAVILRRKSPEALVIATPSRNWRPWTISASLLGANSGLVILSGQVDFLMLGLLATPTDLGHYRVAMQIALVSGFGYMALNMIAAQRFAYLFAAKDMAGLQATATFLARIAFVMTLPLPVLFWFWGEPILATVFGLGFEAAWAPVMILLAVQSMSAACGFGRTLLAMCGAERRIVPLTLIAVLLQAVLATGLIMALGLIGAALANLLSQLFWNLAVTFVALRRFDISPTIFASTRP